MVEVYKVTANLFEECTHIIWDETGEAVIIDCGVYKPGERERFIQFIEQKKLRPVRLLLTHAHHDHLYGNDLIRDRYGLLPEVHKDDEWIMRDHLTIRIAQIYKKYPYEIPMPEHYLTDGVAGISQNYHWGWQIYPQADCYIELPGHGKKTTIGKIKERNMTGSGSLTL